MGKGARFVSDLVEVATTAPGETDLSRWLLDNLSREVQYDSAIYLPLPHRPKPPVALNRERKYQQLYQKLLKEYPRIRAGMEKGRLAAGGTGVYRDAEVFTSKERRDLPFYAEIVRPQGITNQIVAHVVFRGAPCGMLYLSRHGSKRFSAKDEAMIVRLLPAIAMSHAAIRATVLTADDCELTPREQQIAFFIGQGYRNQDIASILGTSARTVRNQISQLFDKLGVTNRAELVARVRR